MATPDRRSSNPSLSGLDEKEDHHAQGSHLKDVEAGLPPDNLMPALSKRSTHPLEQVESQTTYSGWRWFLTCVALYSAAFLYGLDNTIVADIQSAAVETFGAVDKLAWLGSGFPLGSIAVILPVGKAFGRFDVKWLFVGSLILFVGGSALCGGAPTMDALIVGRVIAGAGGAGMYLGILNIISINTTIQRRPIYFALCGLTWGLGCILGPVIGGSFADSSASWRWSFYLICILMGLFCPIYFFVMQPFQPEPDTPRFTKLKSMDWVGTILNIGIYVSFVMAFTFGGTQWKWSDGRTIALIVVFVVLIILFAIQQTFCIFTNVENRLFPVDFLREKDLILQYVCMSASVTSLFIPVYYIPLFFAFARGDSNVDAAVRLLPFIIITIFFVMLNGALMPKWGYYKPWFVTSGVFLLIGGSLMYSKVDPSTSNGAVYGFSVLAAIGAGASQQAAYSITQAKVPINRIADAVGFINSAQIGGIVIALTITGAVFQSVGFRHVSDALGPDFTADDIHAALAGARSTIFERISPEVREKVIAGIVQAISDGYILVIAAGSVLLVSSLIMKREKLFMEMSGGG